MSRSRFRLLGIGVVIFSLGAIGSTTAHAEVGAQWLLAKFGVTVELIAFLPAKIELRTDTSEILHSKISGVAVLFECSTITAVNVMLLANGSIGEKAGSVKGSKAKFSGCITKLNGSTSTPCKPVAGGIENGVINTSSGHGLIVLHELVSGVRHALVQFLPDSGETIATVEMDNECSIGSKVKIIGKFFLQDFTNAAFSIHALNHLFQTGPLTELWTISKTPEHMVSTLGSAFASLDGEHIGLFWSGDPA